MKTGKFLVVFLILMLNAMNAQSRENAEVEKTVCLIADSIISSSKYNFVDKKTGKVYSSASQAPAEAELNLGSPYTDWRYWNGVLNIAMISLSSFMNKPAYSEFAAKNMEFCFDNIDYFRNKFKDQDRWNYPFGQFLRMQELDDCGAMGGSLIEVYNSDPQQRYREYIDRAAGHIQSVQARLENGTLVRTFPHKFTLWADDLYMSIVLLSRMGELTGDGRYFDDAATQVTNFNKYLFNDMLGLMHHCWYSDVDKPGVAYWGRANGWALLAQCDLLDRIPDNHPQRKILIGLLERHILGIAQYQSATGLWHQLLDKPDSFLETSCSAMFTYAVAHAVNKGWIDKRYSSIAKRGWDGINTKVRADGKVEDICAGTGVSDDLVFYYKRPTPLNDIHGLGAVILAGIEVAALGK